MKPSLNFASKLSLNQLLVSNLRVFSMPQSVVIRILKCQIHTAHSTRKYPTLLFHNITLKARESTDSKSTKVKSILDEAEEEKSKKEEESRKGPVPMTKWQKIGYIVFGTSMVSTLIIYGVLFSLPDKDEEGHTVDDSFSHLTFPSQHWNRLKSRFFKTKADLENPFSDKLLPDPLPAGYVQPKYTVLIELTGLLVHADWNHKNGWRFQKRPGLDIFLSQVGYPNFEFVIFTRENAATFFPIVDQLDPDSKFIMYRLFKDACLYTNGEYIKDLSAINRDLSKVIVIDWDEKSVERHPQNALILPKWRGDKADRTLIGLAQLLQTISHSNCADVRDVLSHYSKFDDPIETFRENQRKLGAELEENGKNESTVRSSFMKGFGKHSPGLTGLNK